MMKNESNRLLSKSEVAEMFSVSQRTVDRLAARGKLPSIKIAGCVRFRLSDVLNLMSVK